MNVTELSGVGAKRAHSLYNAGIHTVDDLLAYFPRDYDDRSRIKTVGELVPDSVNTIRGAVVAGAKSTTLRRKGAPPLNVCKLIIKDATGSLEIIWFNQPYLKKYFKVGSQYIFTGKVSIAYGARLQMQAPEYELCGDSELSHGRIVPVYTTPPQFSQKTFRALMHQALQVSANTSECFVEYLQAEVIEKHNLCPRRTAIYNIHFPESNELFMSARRRLVFEELFIMQVALLSLKDAACQQGGVLFKHVDFAKFTAQLPYELTPAQKAVLSEIARDMQSGTRMHRLVQGDVGSGKTAVAMAAAYIAAQNGYQVALMAPTEVLAMQHFAQCEKYFAPFGLECVFLVGGIGAKARREAYKKIHDGRAAIIIGTHALIQEKVEYAKMGLVITDEQHRFGVNQRFDLAKKGTTQTYPHTLVMTATPIPRTLGMILYGDLDISIIDELPPDRQKIETHAVAEKHRTRMREFIRTEVCEGRQVYIICPAIQENEDSAQKLDIKNVLDYTSELINALPGISIAHLHGRMKPAQKQDIMADFKAGNVQVLVSTTVIEVGVDVANASLIIIENAERFGLSQLHQLRGRVGRGTNKSYCILVSDSKNAETKQRLAAMCSTADGFKLAELDLKLRGAGDFFGTRQHGLPNFAIANLYQDMDILAQAQDAAQSITESALLKKRVQQLFLQSYGGL